MDFNLIAPIWTKSLINLPLVYRLLKKCFKRYDTWPSPMWKKAFCMFNSSLLVEAQSFFYGRVARLGIIRRRLETKLGITIERCTPLANLVQATCVATRSYSLGMWRYLLTCITKKFHEVHFLHYQSAPAHYVLVRISTYSSLLICHHGQ